MSIPVDLLFCLTLGLVFAACARRQFERGAPVWGRELWAVLSFVALVLWPTVLYACLVHPDWTWLYTRADAARHAAALAPLVMASCLAALLIGFGAGWAILRQRRAAWLWASIAALVCAGLVLGFALRARLWHYGTFAEYHAGRAPPVLEVRFAWALGVALVGRLVAAIAVGWTLWDLGQRR